MATTVVKATEHVLVETATAVVSSLGAAATAEFKTLESSIAQEAVSATDDDVSNIIQKVEGAVEVVVEEVVNGAEHVVETVKQHPELIAEGALAVAVGVASLVQPELIAGEVAILGKMAADSAKKTVTKIASDEGEKIVKAISKDLAEDAKVEAEKDKLQAEEKKKAEGGEVAVEGEAPKVPEGSEAKPVAEGEKTIAIEIQKPAAKTEEGAADAKSEKEAAPVELKITIGSDGEIKAVSKSVVEEAKPAEKPVEEKPVEEKPVEAKPVAPVVAEKTETPTAKEEVPAPTSQPAAPISEKSLDLPKDVPAPAEPEKSIPAAESKPVEVKDAPAPAKSESSAPEPAQAPASSVPVVKETAIPVTKEVVPAKPESEPSKESPAVEKEQVKEEAKAVEPQVSEPVAEKEQPKEESKAVELPISKSGVEIETNTEPAPLTKAVEISKPAEEISVAPIAAEPKEVVQPEILAELGIVHSEVAEEPAKTVLPEEKQETVVPQPEEPEANFVEQLLHRSNSGEPIIPVEEVQEAASSPQPAIVETIPDVKQAPAVEASTVVDSKTEEVTAGSEQPVETIAQKEPEKPEQVPATTQSEVAASPQPIQQDIPEVKTAPEPSQVSSDEKAPIPSAISQAKDLAVSALESSSTESGPTLVTAAASVTNITKTTTTKTVEVPSDPGVPMVTVSQESLDILHSKLDAMHEAIQLITRTLATHLPAPQSPVPVIAKEIETESAPVPIAPAVSEPVAQEPESPIQAQPTTNTTSGEITPVLIPTPSASTETDSPAAPETQTTVPKRPTHVKRGSVIGSIGKFLWPFGGSTAPPKDTSVQVSTVEVSGEVEVGAAGQKVGSKDGSSSTAPGPELSKASSTVGVTEVLATPVAV
ncbi:hypothetical protein BKA61DRAFT_661094 [Leptodontidium sp. MPI-SDFR-AT-0119]|nr:hypothetical protein BKA61DRAFT_661094 [Leptodontidium sp. MPI-SDFR-AT-0119]